MKNPYLVDPQERQRRNIWDRGRALGGNANPNIYRLDDYGAVIKWDAYGLPRHKYGWGIDFIDFDCNNKLLSNTRPLFLGNLAARQVPPDADGFNLFFQFNNSDKKNNSVVRYAGEVEKD